MAVVALLVASKTQVDLEDLDLQTIQSCLTDLGDPPFEIVHTLLSTQTHLSFREGESRGPTDSLSKDDSNIIRIFFRRNRVIYVFIDHNTCIFGSCP